MTQAHTTRSSSSSVFDGPDDDHFPAFHPRLIPRDARTWRVELADAFDGLHVWTGEAKSKAEAIHLAARSLSVYCPFFKADDAQVVACTEVV